MAVEKTIKVALAGCGTVGSGVADIVVHRGDALARRTGLRFEITRALVSNLHRERTAPLPKEVYTDDPADLARTDADMLVEVMGGTDTAGCPTPSGVGNHNASARREIRTPSGPRQRNRTCSHPATDRGGSSIRIKHGC
jgi:hypothetical protein